MTRILVALALLCTAGSAWANPVWAVGKGEGTGCFKGQTRRSGAKYCHNCVTAGGDKVDWTFELLCDGKDTGRRSTVYLDCPAGSDEGVQLRALMAKVNLPNAGTACPTTPKAH